MTLMSELTWRWTKPLESDKVILSFEKMLKYEFPEAFLECAVENNGGRPSKSMFKTKDGSIKVIKRLLPFDSSDTESIWKLNDCWHNGCTIDEHFLRLYNQYVVFAIDHFGNFICFDKSNDSVKFVELETLKVSDVAHNFDEFLDMLYETSNEGGEL